MKPKIILIALLAACAHAQASSGIQPHLAKRAIVGEGAGESWPAKLAIASALRNRGTLKGVYGLRAHHIEHEPKWVWRHADAAWAESAKHDFAYGCNMFGGVIDDHYFQHVLHLKPVFTIGNTRFYRQS